MAGVRNSLQSRVTHVDMLAAVSTATLGVESGTFDCRSYPKGSRFIACFATGAMTEGTLTYSVVDCDTSGGTYTATTDLYGSLAAVTTDNDIAIQTISFQPTPGRPFIKLKTVETVSVTTAVPVHQWIVVVPPAVV